MDIINQIINWFEINWGVTVFGTTTIGGLITMCYLFVKQKVAFKAQGTKYEKLFNGSQETFTKLAVLYEAEKARGVHKDKQAAFMQASQSVLMDAIIKMALSSKLDSDDKASIVANVEHLKLLAPMEIVEQAKDTVTTVGDNLQKELTENPAQTVVTIAQGVSSLLDKYNTKQG